jgi:hypothetical protein
MEKVWALPPSHSLWTLNLHGNVALTGDKTVGSPCRERGCREFRMWVGVEAEGTSSYPLMTLDYYNAICG